jgi:hypothetical protein
MKYENYGKVLDIAAKITKLKNLLDDISVDDTVVEIKGYFSRNPGIIIGPGERWVNEYTPIAAVFIDTIKENIKNKIAELKEELDKL